MNAPVDRYELTAGETVMVIRRHQDLAELFRLMKDRWNLSDGFCDQRGGLTNGHTNKILGPSATKNVGPSTFDLFCEMFAIEFHARIDMAAVKRMEQVWEQRARPPYVNKRVSKELLERAKPHVLKGLSAVGNAARNAMLPGEHRSKIARKAAKARWKKHRRERRVKAAQPACVATV